MRLQWITIFLLIGIFLNTLSKADKKENKFAEESKREEKSWIGKYKHNNDLSGRLFIPNPFKLFHHGLGLDASTATIAISTLVTKIVSEKITATLNGIVQDDQREQVARNLLVCFNTNFNQLITCQNNATATPTTSVTNPTTSVTNPTTTVTTNTSMTSLVVVASCAEANSACANAGKKSTAVSSLAQKMALSIEGLPVFAGATSTANAVPPGLTFTFLDGTQINTNTDDSRWLTASNALTDTCLLWDGTNNGLINIAGAPLTTPLIVPCI